MKEIWTLILSCCLFAIAALSTTLAIAQTTNSGLNKYYRHSVFDNSRGPETYYYAKASTAGPSSLTSKNGNLPISNIIFRTPPNALSFEYISAPGGDWKVEIIPNKHQYFSDFDGDTLSYWIYSEQELNRANTPRIYVIDGNGAWSPVVDLIGSNQIIHAGKWTQIRLHKSAFDPSWSLTSDEPISFKALRRIMIVQGLDDNRKNKFYLDDMRILNPNDTDQNPPNPPQNLKSKSYERHIDLVWDAPSAQDIEYYEIYRRVGIGEFLPIGIQSAQHSRYSDYVGEITEQIFYKLSAVDYSGNKSNHSILTNAKTRPMSDEELLEMVQEAAFRYYWDGENKDSGMAVEVLPGNHNQIAVGASGFGIMAIITGIERGFISREDGRKRLIKILNFLERAPRFHGVWPHYLNGETAQIIPAAGKYDNGGDLVETAFLMQGLLTARQYFGQNNADEIFIKDKITEFWREIEWDWYRPTKDSDFLYWHWSPDHGFRIKHPLIGWNETLMPYLLGIASPTHPIPPSMWHTGWAGKSDFAAKYRETWSHSSDGNRFINGKTYYGEKLEVGTVFGGDLFFTHFSFMGFDPRGKRDLYTNYFKNNRAIAKIQYNYAIANPNNHIGYGPYAWGQSVGINAGSGRTEPARDIGTLTISGAISSMPYTPQESIRALKHFYRVHGKHIWGTYGFADGFNQSKDWYHEVYMGLNAAPMVVMIENHRSGLIWKNFMANPEIAPALEKIGFVRDDD